MVLRVVSLFRRGWIKLCLLLVLVYAAICVGYHHLPWRVQQPLYRSMPGLHRVLQRTGFRIMQGWDELALIGRDAAIELQEGWGDGQAYAGLPAQGFQLFDRVRVLENHGFTVGYSESLKDPIWVAYRIFDVPRLHSPPRPSRFRIDERTRARVGHNDYTRSGYDRGHMAPNYGIATRYGEKGQYETFLMSNIIPQVPRINRYIWKDLEMLVAKRYGRCFGEVWVVTGPVFEKPIERLPSGVAVPSRCYKIIADEHGGRLRVLAFLIESDCPPYTRIRTRLVSIDEIERLTGLDFFPELPDDTEALLESAPATRLWPSLLPAARYHLTGKTY
jgi:endonuclease G